jgi:transcriptional regulator with XRE-family HTH domain
MSAYDLVVKAKENMGFTSDFQLAEALGVHRMLVSNWKLAKSKPDGLTMLKLTKFAGLSIDDALNLVQGLPSQRELALNVTSELYIMLNGKLNLFREFKRKLFIRKSEFRFKPCCINLSMAN